MSPGPVTASDRIAKDALDPAGLLFVSAVVWRRHHGSRFFGHKGLRSKQILEEQDNPSTCSIGPPPAAIRKAGFRNNWTMALH